MSTRKPSWLSGVLGNIPVTGDPEPDNVVPLKPASIEALLLELSAYNRDLLDQSLQIQRDDMAYAQRRNDAAHRHNSARKRMLETRSKLSDLMKTYGGNLDFPTIPPEIEIVGRSPSTGTLRPRPEPTHEDDAS